MWKKKQGDDDEMRITCITSKKLGGDFRKKIIDSVEYSNYSQFLRKCIKNFVKGEIK